MEMKYIHSNKYVGGGGGGGEKFQIIIIYCKCISSYRCHHLIQNLTGLEASSHFPFQNRLTQIETIAQLTHFKGPAGIVARIITGRV